MSPLKKLVILLFLVGFYSPSYAAVDVTDFTSCTVFSEAEESKGDKKDGDKKEEEEPDCE